MQLKDKETTFVKTFAYISFFIGLIILVSFIIAISNDKVNITNTSKVGDFIGGVVGSIWALTAVFVFYLALIVNRKEFKLHTEELKLQREQLNLQREEMRKQNIEFRLNRITNVAYKQVEICENNINNFEILNVDSMTKIKGREAINWLNEELQSYSNYRPYEFSAVEEETLDFNAIYFNQWVKINQKEISKLTDTIFNSCELIKLLLAENIDVSNKIKDELKTIFLANLGKDVDLFYELLSELIDKNNIKLAVSLVDQIQEIRKYQTFKYVNLDRIRKTTYNKVQNVDSR